MVGPATGRLSLASQRSKRLVLLMLLMLLMLPPGYQAN
jgi:hypothetical protein